MWEQIRANQRRSAVLVIVMAGFLFLVGYLLGEVFAPGMGLFGLFIAFCIWLVMTLVSFYAGDRIFLAMSGARKIGPQDHAVLFNIVEEMKIASGLPKMPDVYIIDDEAPNAFATGRNPERAAVAVTTGLLKVLSRDELQGVIAHEMGHIRNRDILYMLVVGIMMGTIVILADIGVRVMFYGGGSRRTSRSKGGGQAQAVILLVALALMILAPIVAQLIYFAISRRREYLADASSAQFTRYPEGLAAALEKISAVPAKLASATRATAPMYIVNPLNVSRRGLSDLSSTHPSIKERVRILRAMGGGAGLGNYDQAFRKVTGRPVGVVPHSALEASPDLTVEKPGAGGEKDEGRVDRARQVTDMLRRMDRFIFLTCPCGTKLKVPPAYAGKTVKCPRCHTPHVVGQPQA